MATRHPELSKLIAPFDLDAFFEKHWCKKVLHVKGAAEKFVGLFDLSRWQLGEFTTELEAASRDASGMQEQFAIQPAQIAPLFASGLTICAGVGAHPSIAPMLAAFGRELGMAGGPAFAKLYASRNDGGFAVHFDQHHVFVAQLEGQKRWRYTAPVVQAPIASGQIDAEGVPRWGFPQQGMPIEVEAPRADSFDSVVLSPGDMLYLPPGAWHEARAIDMSVAISISPPRSPAYQILLRAIEDELMQRPAWRHDVFEREPGTGGVVSATVKAQFGALIDDLGALLRTLDQRGIHRVWRLNVLSGDPTPPSGRTLGKDDLVQHNGPGVRRYLIAPLPAGDVYLHFYGGGAEWSFPVEAKRFVDGLASHERFVASEACSWDPELDWPDVQDTLQQLLDAGLLAWASD